jgi:hypothetical protein
MSLALPHHSPASCSSPSLTCYLALALFYHLLVSCSSRTLACVFAPPLSLSIPCMSLALVQHLPVCPPPPPNTSSSPSRLHVSPYNVCLIDSSRFSSLSASIFL